MGYTDNVTGKINENNNENPSDSTKQYKWELALLTFKYTKDVQINKKTHVEIDSP